MKPCISLSGKCMKEIKSCDRHMAVATSDANRMAGNSVSLKTFDKWQLSNIIGRKVDGTDVTEVWCKTCTRHAVKIRAGLKGKALQDFDIYVPGSK